MKTYVLIHSLDHTATPPGPSVFQAANDTEALTFATENFWLDEACTHWTLVEQMVTLREVAHRSTYPDTIHYSTKKIS